MPAKTALSRVTSLDFFGVVIPGLYLTCIISLFGFLFLDDVTPEKSPWKVINDSVASVTVAGGMLMLFVSYLLGSISRAFPVKWPDALCGFIRRDRQWPWPFRSRPEIYNAEYPYPKSLERQFVALGEHNRFDVRCDPTDEPDSHVSINFWKVEVCEESAPLFLEVSRAEARTRMFAGMFWATGISVPIGIGQLWAAHHMGSDWWKPLPRQHCSGSHSCYCCVRQEMKRREPYFFHISPYIDAKTPLRQAGARPTSLNVTNEPPRPHRRVHGEDQYGSGDGAAVP